MATIQQSDQGRNNNFNLIRLIAATMVIFSHSYWVTGNEPIEPLGKFCGLVNFGTLGLKIFFFISGYLITKSLYRQPTLTSFAWARVLRIFPALFFAAIFCAFVIGPICTTLTLHNYFTDTTVYNFLWHMTTLHAFYNVLPGVFKSNPGSIGVNIPLWTLPAELLMYFCVLLWGVILLLWKKQFKSMPAAGLIIIIYAFCWGIPYYINFSMYISNWGLLFLLGMLCQLFSKKIILNIPLFIVMFIGFLILFHYRFRFTDAAFDIVMAYGILICAYHPQLQIKDFHRLGDFSYGLYIYAFPIQQLFAFKFPAVKPIENFLLTFVFGLALAVPSWYFVEKPMLGLKSKKPAGI